MNYTKISNQKLAQKTLKIRTPISYYGGKQSMVGKIVPLIPKHKIYLEPFVGGGAVFWSKPQSELECINDLNGHVITFYKVLKSNFSLLRRLVSATASSRLVHRQSEYILKNSELYDDTTIAWAFWVQTNMSFSSTIFGGYGYGRGITCVRKMHNKRLQFLKRLSQRLDVADIECNDALKVIASRDTPETFHYIDPPYYNANMGHYAGYTQEDFIELLKLLTRIKGKFILSSYPSQELADFTAMMGWKTVEIVKPIVACKGDRSKTKTEVLTMNY